MVAKNAVDSVIRVCIITATVGLTSLGSGSLGWSWSELAGGGQPGELTGAAQRRIKVNPDGYTSARVCGQCHQDIYNSWKNSLHAFSLSDPIFDTAFMQAIKAGGDEARRLCLRCHAPMTMFNGDYELSQGITREGVSCDFCHSVTAVDLDGGEASFSSQPGRVKRGDIKSTQSPAHEVVYSKLHTTSEFCGGCHNYVAPGGAAIMSTYDEWRKGPYAAEGVQCQSCHMVLGAGKVVLKEVQKSRDEIHLHSLIRDREQLRSALSVQITRADRSGDSLTVEVLVENIGSGHRVPTGMPTREIVLQVTVESGGYSRTEERRYRKIVGDAKGRPLSTDYETMLKGVQVLNDTRIAPREQRHERFRFRVQPSARVQVDAVLAYYYAPSIMGVQKINVRLGEARRVVS